jgi:hypothetical protein
MKNLRKVLSLALVVALSLSLVIVAGAKTLDEYTDKDSIGTEYLEAVELLSALGVFEGDENGALNPQGTFTRAQAAKIVTYITIGSSAASLAQAPTQFDDVPASHWASGYVSFASQRNIINGTGGGKFDPDSPVTGAQLAKLLLVAIGYGAKGEYVGSSWELNSIVDGQRLYILTGTADHSAPATREQSIQYVFNALQTQIVSYNQLFDAYLNASTSDFVTIKRSNLAAETFETAKVDIKDDFGYSNHYWAQRGVRKTADYISDIIIGTVVSSAMVTQGSLYNDYQWSETVELYVNGWAYDDPNVAGTDNEFPSSAFVVRGSMMPANAEPGVKFDLIDLYPFDGKVNKIVATYEYLAKVTRVNAMAGTIDFTLYDVGGGVAISKPYTGVPVDETFVRDDYIVVIPTNNTLKDYNNAAPGFISIKKAEVVKAVPTRYTTNIFGAVNELAGNAVDTVTINGEVKYVSGTQFLKAVGAMSFVESTFYLDSNGFIVGLDAVRVAASNQDYLLVNAKAAGFGSSYFSDNRLSVTFPDGTKSVIDVAFNTKGAPAGSVTTAAGIVDGTWYTYIVNSDGKYVINALPSDTQGTPAQLAYSLTAISTASFQLLDAGKALVRDDVGTSSGLGYLLTQISLTGPFYFNSSSVLKINGKTYTGLANFPSYSTPVDTDASHPVNILVVFGENAQGERIGNLITNVYISATTAPSTGIYGVIGGKISNESATTALYSVITLDAPTGEFLVGDWDATSNGYQTGQAVEIAVAADGGRSITSGASIPATAYGGLVTVADTAHVVVSGGTGAGDYYISPNTIIYDTTSLFGGMNGVIGNDVIDVGETILIYGGVAGDPSQPANAIAIVLSVNA